MQVFVLISTSIKKVNYYHLTCFELKPKSYILNNRELWFFLSCLAILFASLLIGWQGSIHAISAPYDGERYLHMAKSIVRGEWLGPYNYLTLIRLPIYPVFLAINSMTGWPLHIVQHIIFLISILLLVIALRNIEIQRWRLIIICALCAFHPITIYFPTLLVTEAIYIPLSTMLFAGCIGLLNISKKSFTKFAFWIMVVSTSLSLLWYTRPERIWVIPFLIFWIFLLIFQFNTNRGPYKIRLLAVILVPLIFIFLLGQYITRLNEKYYGVKIEFELNEPNSVAAFRWLSRIEPESHRPYVPVTAKAMDTAYSVSPHFAKLKPYLTKQLNGGPWLNCGCEWMGICDELVGGWSFWAIREGASSIGVHDNAIKASTFYAAVAQELRQACISGQIPYSRNPTGNRFAPPTSLDDIPRIMISTLKWTWKAIRLEGFANTIVWVSKMKVNESLIESYREISHDQSDNRGLIPEKIIKSISVFMIIQTIGCGIFILFLIKTSLNRLRHKHFNWERLNMQQWLIISCALFFLSRIAIVGYVDAMSFHVQMRYSLPVILVLNVLVGLILTSFKPRKNWNKDMDKKKYQTNVISDFGEQWTAYTKNSGWFASVEEMESLFGPLLDKKELIDKKIADVGAGTGHYTQLFHRVGAGKIIAIEPSDAYKILKSNIQGLDNINCLKATAEEIPNQNFDWVFCIGVLQFIPDPVPALKAMGKALGSQGRIFIWVYGKENNALYLAFLKPLRLLTTILPHRLLDLFAEFLYYPASSYAYICSFLPLPLANYMRGYFSKLDHYSRKLTIYDQLNPKVSHYYSRDELKQLLETCGFTDIRIYHRLSYSWSVVARYEDYESP